MTLGDVKTKMDQYIGRWTQNRNGLSPKSVTPSAVLPSKKGNERVRSWRLKRWMSEHSASMPPSSSLTPVETPIVSQTHQHPAPYSLIYTNEDMKENAGLIIVNQNTKAIPTGSNCPNNPNEAPQYYWHCFLGRWEPIHNTGPHRSYVHRPHCGGPRFRPPWWSPGSRL